MAIFSGVNSFWAKSDLYPSDVQSSARHETRRLYLLNVALHVVCEVIGHVLSLDNIYFPTL